MWAAHRIVDALALAGAPAFVCRRDGEGLHITARTPAFTAAIDGLAGQLDEPQLLAALAAYWQVGANPPIVVRAKTAPVWQCVLRDLGDGDHLVLFRVVDERQEHNMVFFNVLQSLSTVVARVDRNLRNLYVNPAVDQVVAPRRAQDLIGKDNAELEMPEGLIDAWARVYRQVFETGVNAEHHVEFPTPDGPRQFLYRVVPEAGPDGKVRSVLAVAHDISEIKELQRRLELLAQTDPLTGLLNRRSFVDRLEAELARSDRDQARLSVLVLDVDDFKAVNDRHGHIVGDSVLESVGWVLQQSVGASDLAARLGGDEFCVALVDCEPDDARMIAERIRRRIAAVASPRISASIGVASATPEDRNVADLIARVDERMYRAKLAGKNHVDAGIE